MIIRGLALCLFSSLFFTLTNMPQVYATTTYTIKTITTSPWYFVKVHLIDTEIIPNTTHESGFGPASGNQTFTVTGEPTSVEITIAYFNNSFPSMTMQIIRDGKVLTSKTLNNSSMLVWDSTKEPLPTENESNTVPAYPDASIGLGLVICIVILIKCARVSNLD